MNPRILLAALPFLLLLPACTHVKGVVLDERTLKPVPDAEFTVGHPKGIGVYQRHRTDSKGRFDFHISPTDENYLYLWDGKGDANMAARRIPRSDISDNMTIHLRPGDAVSW